MMVRTEQSQTVYDSVDSWLRTLYPSFKAVCEINIHKGTVQRWPPLVIIILHVKFKKLQYSEMFCRLATFEQNLPGQAEQYTVLVQ